ncbi:hypothetical protein DL95DRAFT_460154 [Leptodontidium sp. 2 PMI_412]|nr:hypothetical protein DL95DRAFT_460154 [Leptodontidium sp. 2 PMI_412]
MSTPLPEMESEISDTTLTGPNLAIRRAAFVRGTLHRLTITTSTLTTCTLANCIITNSTIKDCSLSNCNISTSTLVKCKITNSALHESPFLKSKLSGCRVMNSPSILRKILLELRRMIFKDCLKIQDGKSPALLIALRSDKELYEQALEVYYKIIYFTVTPELGGARERELLEELSPRALSGIEMLRINIHYVPSFLRETVRLLKKRSNINTVLLEYEYASMARIALLDIRRGLGTISEIYLAVRADCSGVSAVDTCSACLGFEGKKVVGEIDGLTDLWCWQAEEGRVLT